MRALFRDIWRWLTNLLFYRLSHNRSSMPLRDGNATITTGNISNVSGQLAIGRKNVILPLLNGLDKVAELRHAACMQMIRSMPVVRSIACEIC
jgi:hypothetical protein